MNKITQVAKIISDAKVAIRETEAMGILSVSHDGGMHVSFGAFVHAFQDFKVEDRNCTKYPYEVVARVHGVKIYAIASSKEFKDAFPDAKTPQELYIEKLEAEVESLKFESEQQKPYKGEV